MPGNADRRKDRDTADRQDPVVWHHLREIECKRKEQPHWRLAPEPANLREISGGLRRRVGRRSQSAPPLLRAEELYDDRARFGGAPACEQPARRFRHRVANEQHPDGNDRPEPEHGPPRADRQVAEREKRGGRSEDRADVPGCVDQPVDASAISGRDEFFDRRVDRTVLAADADTGDKTKHRQRREVPRKTGQHGCDAVDRKRNEEQAPSPEAVGKRAEDQSTREHAHRIDRIDPRCRRAAEMQVFRDVCEDRCGDGRFEAVEDPRNTECDDDAQMYARPNGAVENVGDVHRRRPIGVRRLEIMRILITNDDGIDSPGIAALVEILSAEHEPLVVAPSENRSGVSHAITTYEAITVRASKRRERAFLRVFGHAGRLRVSWSYGAFLAARSGRQRHQPRSESCRRRQLFREPSPAPLKRRSSAIPAVAVSLADRSRQFGAAALAGCGGDDPPLHRAHRRDGTRARTLLEP